MRCFLMTHAAPVKQALARQGRIMLAGVAVACIGSAHALAQEQRYDTPQYTGTGSSLDKNFGLPSFGMPNAGLPQQKTQEPTARVPEKPDFFAKTPEYYVPAPRASTALEMETPLFTTPEGSTTGDDTMTGSNTDNPPSTYNTNTPGGAASGYTVPR